MIAVHAERGVLDEDWLLDEFVGLSGLRAGNVFGFALQFGDC